MVKPINYSEDSEFYKEFKQTNPTLVLGLIIISFGLYIINWVFLRNKDLEKLDEEAPDANRGAIIMMVLPFSWFFIIMVLKNLFFSHENLFVGILEISGFGFIIFLLLKYIFDFCMSFGRITKTHGVYWYILYFLGIAGLVFMGVKFYWGGLLTLLLVLVVPAMQAEFNSHFNRFSMKKKNNIYYS